MPAADETLQQAWSLHESGRIADAERIYRGVLSDEPTNANAWCYLGLAQHGQGCFANAIDSYRLAIDLNPNFAEAWNNLGNSQLALGDHDIALRSFERALQIKPDYASAKSNIGVVLLTLGRFDEGWPFYRARHKRWRLSADYDQPRWTGDSLDGRTILLHAEQGLGDTLHFIRYASVLKSRYDCRIIAAVQRPLLRLLESCDGIDELISKHDDPPAFDTHATLVDVPGLLNETADSLSNAERYLSPPKELIESWKRRLSHLGGLRIGIAWQGNAEFKGDHRRSVALDAFAPLGKLHGVTLISLQKENASQQIADLCGRFAVQELDEDFDTTSGAFMDTAAVMSELDLVISVDTAVAHLAGALGVPTWLALGQSPDWRWLLDRDDSPWYPSARLFRRSKLGTWRDVFTRMADELCREHPSVRVATRDDVRIATTGFNQTSRCEHGLLIYNRHDAPTGCCLARTGQRSPAKADLYRQLINPGDVVVQAGAHVGVHTLLFSQLVGNAGLVIAFEPQRIPFQTLCGNMALNARTNVDCRCTAIGESSGLIGVPELPVNSRVDFAGVRLGESPAATGQPMTTVPAISIDDMELARCDFVDLDINGMELAALTGATDTIKRCRPILNINASEEQCRPELLGRLHAFGYRAFWHLSSAVPITSAAASGSRVLADNVSVSVVGVDCSMNVDADGLVPIRDAFVKTCDRKIETGKFDIQ